jgi:hypothetical protein
MWMWASANIEWILVAMAMAILITPIALYLTGPWVYRRREILALLPAPAAALYFKQFFADMPEAERRLPRFYDARFGRRRYVVPVLLLVLLAIIPIDWAIESALAWSGHPGTAVRLPPQAVAAIAGAYSWVAADVLSRWQYRDLLPIHVTSAALRFAVALPLAYAFGSLVAADLKIFVAFAISAFPTRALLTITRRIFQRKLDLGDAGDRAESQLEKLQGIDTRVAERFADEGYTTVLQLAYADPIELTMRCSSFGFSFVTDCASQALAWIYLEDRLATLRVMSLRGAQEIANFVDELNDDSDPDVLRERRALLDAAADKLTVPAPALERTFQEIAEDPYTEFLRSVWQQPSEPAK